MTDNKQGNKNKWSLAGAAAKAGALGKGAPVAPAKNEPVKSAPVAPAAPVKSEPAAAKSAPAANAAVKSEPLSVAPEKSAPVQAPPAKSQPAAAYDAPEELVELVKLEAAAPVVVAKEIRAELLVVAAAPQSAPEVAVWTKAWPGKSVELWSENTEALLGFASALSKAKSVTEVVELQSQFANERVNRFLRLSGEIAPLPKFFFFAA